MEKQFTPGPWVSSSQKGEPGHCLCAQVFNQKKDGENLAVIEPTKSEEGGTANANLMSASPDLLDALEHIRGLPEFKNLWSSTKQMVEKAISKAYGVD